MRKYMLIIITGFLVMGATIAVVAGYPGRFFTSSPDEVRVSASQAILDIHRYNYGAGALLAEGKIELFEKNKTAGEPTESMPFRYCVTSGKFYQQTGPVEMINGKEYALYIHHEKRLIQLARAEDTPQMQQYTHAALIDSILRDNRMSATVGKAGSDLVLTVNPPQGENITEYRIFYSPADFLIKKIEMDLLKPADETDANETPGKELIVITYDKLSKSIGDAEGLFSEKKYVKKSRKTFALTSEFSGYQLINLIPDK